MSTDALTQLENTRDMHYTTDTAYAWCKLYTQQRASNFYYAFAILPAEKRDSIYAAYAFSGYVDDIADELQDRKVQEDAISQARRELKDCYRGTASGPLFTALLATIKKYDIPQEYFEELVNGVEMDFTINRYPTWSDLEKYCYRVASMVGLICTSIFGTKPDENMKQYAIKMGLGLQIVNIMRDVTDDAKRGRIYFPQDELVQHQLTDKDILEGLYDERFISLMKQQGERAREYFLEGRRLLPLLDNRSRMCVNVMQGFYFEILKRIEQKNYNVTAERVGLTSKEKIFAIARLWLTALLNTK